MHGSAEACFLLNSLFDFRIRPILVGGQDSSSRCHFVVFQAVLHCLKLYVRSVRRLEGSGLTLYLDMSEHERFGGQPIYSQPCSYIGVSLWNRRHVTHNLLSALSTLGVCQVIGPGVRVAQPGDFLSAQGLDFPFLHGYAGSLGL